MKLRRARQLLMLIGIALSAATTMLAARPIEARHDVDHLTFHGNAARTGWYDAERRLTPQTLRGGNFQNLWNSPPLGAAGDVPARLFASPLFVADARIRTDRGEEKHDIVIAASATGYVAAITADAHAGRKPGDFLWQRRITSAPCGRGTNGILSTPVVERRTARIFLVACDETDGWRIHALRLDTGEDAARSPLRDLAAQINAPGINRNGDTVFPSGTTGTQRGALSLAQNDTRLLVTFGGEPLSGWLVAIDTTTLEVKSAFAMTPRAEEGNGGLWASGGASIDANGSIYLATGSSVLNTLAGMGERGVFPDSAGNWSQSIVALRFDGQGRLTLTGSYTPFNYCQVGGTDIDLGSGTPLPIDLLGKSGTQHLLVHTGSKQGNAYLLDRDHLPGSLQRRPPCETDLLAGAARDRSLLAPQVQPQFGVRGPLNVFGPYSERYGMGDYARSRTTPAYFRDARGRHFIFATGNTKVAEDSAVDGGPGLARLEITSNETTAPFLRIDAAPRDLIFRNPGVPFVSSNGARDAIVWVMDVNAPRSALLYGTEAPRPILYAIDATTLEILWRSSPGQLHPSGKYNEPIVARSTVLVGTDRIQAFGLRPAQKNFRVRSAAPSATPNSTASIRSATSGNSTRESTGDIDAAALYQLHCAACHELERVDIPHRRRLEKLETAFIREKLTLGSMQSAARALSDPQIAALAEWIANSSH